MIKALVIAPYEGLIELFKNIIPEVEGFEFKIELGNLHEGISKAKNAEKEGYDLIISRGGTATLIQEYVSIPVINIQVSGYDILRIVTLVKGFSGNAAIVAFPNISRGASTICSILDLDILTIPISIESEVDGKLKELKEVGFEVVIGDVITTEAAKKIGLNGILITSGREAILESLDEAKRVTGIFLRMKKDLSLLKMILDTDDRAIALVDKNQNLTFRNNKFLKVIDNFLLENTSEFRSKVKKAFTEKVKQTFTLELNQQFWRVNINPTQDLVILFLDNLSGYKVLKKLNKNKGAVEFKSEVPFETLIGKHEASNKVIQQINTCANINIPIWIESENGNGKELIAKSIYLTRGKENNPFVIIHCDLLADDQLKELIHENFLLDYESSVYFQNIDSLNQRDQRLLLKFLKHIQEQDIGPRWIVSSTETIESLVKVGIFNRDLYHKLARFVIYQPPLRERHEDMKNLVQLFISEYHLRYGSQVVGIREDALIELLTYDWPGNVEQLKQTVQQLVLEAETHYIEKVDIQSEIHRIKQRYKNVAKINNVNMDGTLEEIEQEIIRKVLEEENMNQSQAAKRLGINRSTLWRKLK